MTFHTVSLGDVSEIQIGPFGSLLHKSDYIDGGVPVINPMHIAPVGIAADSSFSVPDQKASELKRYLLRRGEVIMGRRGEMGRCALVLEEHEGMICGTGSMKIIPSHDELVPEYLVHILRTPKARKELEKAASGVTMLNLNAKALAGLEIPLPPLAEQKRIAAIMDQAEALLRLRSLALGKLNKLIPALYHEVPLSESREVSLAEVCDFENGDRGKNYPGKSSLLSEGIPFVSAADLDAQGELKSGGFSYISRERFDLLGNGKLNGGEFLFCLRGSLGKYGRVPDDFEGAIASSLVILRPHNELNKEYFHAYLGSHEVEKEVQYYSNGLAQPNLSAASLKKFRIKIAPMPVQELFSAKVRSIRSIRASHIRSLRSEDKLFASVQDRAFRGEL